MIKTYYKNIAQALKKTSENEHEKVSEKTSHEVPIVINGEDQQVNHNNHRKITFWGTVRVVITFLFVVALIHYILLIIYPWIMAQPVQVHVYPASLYTLVSQDNLDSNLLNVESYSEEPIDKVISCYYTMPTENSTKSLMPESLNPHLCTHINLAFFMLNQSKVIVTKQQEKIIKDILKLKTVNPDLKILMSIGGGSTDGGFPEMVSNHTTRKTFIKSIKFLLRNYSLNGIDLDWEFPGFSYQENFRYPRQRQHFSQLLREIRAEYVREKRDYLLTVAAAAPESVVSVAYDVDQLNLYCDYVNIMTYDYHAYTQYTPFTGLNAPLYARAGERLFLATLNVNYTVHMYLARGLERRRLVLGVPTYGHTFRLVNADNRDISSPASGFGSVGGDSGFVTYPDVCRYLRRGGATVRWEPAARVPYLYRGHDWFSFDNQDSVMEKAKYIMQRGLRGAMIYALNADDFEGVCGAGGGAAGAGGGAAGAAGAGAEARFPLARSVKEVLRAQLPASSSRRR